MNIRNMVLASLLAVYGTGGLAFAQSDIPSTFDYTLETLRQSVARLAKENESLAAQNAAMQGRIKSSESNLRALEEESKKINDKKLAQLEKERRRPGNVDMMKESLTRTADELQQLTKNVADGDLELKKMEAEALDLQQKVSAYNTAAAGMDDPDLVSEPFRNQMAAAQIARDRAKKDFYDVANRLQEAKKRWQEYNTAVSMRPKQLEEMRAGEASLKKTVAGLESETAALKIRLAEARKVSDAFKEEDYSDLRFGRLQSEIKDVGERNRKVEVDLFAMQKTQDEKLKHLQEDRDSKLKEYQGKMGGLNKRNQDLRKELAALRQEMVALDKKKSQLEGDVYAAH